MNIYAKHGDKVIFNHPNYGYPSDQQKAKEHLILGQHYTVDFTEVSRSSTKVYLVGFPDIFFNSVLFDDAVRTELPPPDTKNSTAERTPGSLHPSDSAFDAWMGYPNVPVAMRDAFKESFVRGWNAAIEAALLKTPSGSICNPQVVADEMRTLISPNS